LLLNVDWFGFEGLDFGSNYGYFIGFGLVLLVSKIWFSTWKYIIRRE